MTTDTLDPPKPPRRPEDDPRWRAAEGKLFQMLGGASNRDFARALLLLDMAERFGARLPVSQTIDMLMEGVDLETAFERLLPESLRGRE